MSFMNWFKKKEEPTLPEVYTEEEIHALETHIQQYFGNFDSVFHEIISPDIHVDIALIKPTPARNYHILTTMGMGAHRMNVPSELAEHKLERAELLICLPPDWRLVSNDFDVIEDDEDIDNPDSPANERWYWPLRWLKNLARLPISGNTWLGFGHTVPNGKDAEPFAENTELGCVILVPPVQFDKEAQICAMPDGSQVIFYQMLPLYADEMNHKLEHGTDALLEKIIAHPALENVLTLDIERPSALEE